MHFGSFRLVRYITKVLGTLSRFFVRKQSCLPWSSCGFWKFSPRKLYTKVMGPFSRFLHSKMKLFAVEFRPILEVLCLQGLHKKFWAHFYDSCVQKWSCFLRSSDAFRKFSPCEVYNESSGHIIMTYASKNVTVWRDVQTHLGTFLLARFMQKVLGEISRFMRLKTKLFAVKLTRILEVFSVQAL